MARYLRLRILRKSLDDEYGNLKSSDLIAANASEIENLELPPEVLELLNYNNLHFTMSIDQFLGTASFYIGNHFIKKITNYKIRKSNELNIRTIIQGKGSSVEYI